MKRIALITGGTHGIGRATAIKLAQQGNDIIVCSRTKERVGNMLLELQEYPVNSYGYTFN